MMTSIEWEPNLTRLHDPSDDLDYSFNWSEWLADVPDGDEADTISTSIWSVSGDDASLAGNDATNDNTSTTIWLSGGTAGVDYTVTNRIVTAGGRTKELSFIVSVQQR
jgi:hypothetical protein